MTVAIYDSFEVHAKANNLANAIKMFRAKCSAGTRVKAVGHLLYVEFANGIKRIYDISYK